MNGGALPEELVKFAQVLGEDADLRAWFESLAAMTDAARGREFQRLAAHMQAEGEHPELVQATALLAQPAVYRAVEAAVAESRGPGQAEP